VAFGLSETSIYELARIYHLLEVFLFLVLLSAPHLLKHSFGLLRGAVDELFGFITYIVCRWYSLRTGFLDERTRYEQRRQALKKKPSHSVQRIVLASDGQSASESPLPT
jgi:hypothetical protein